VGGHRVSRGELLLVSLPAANHDPALTPEPGNLNITRTPTHHLAFGHGIHHCLGAPLSRIELTVALPMLLRRLPKLALAVEPTTLTFKRGSVVHGLRELPITW
jgi:cytochrome P450